MKKVYLASPLFSPAERAFNERLCSVLEHFFDVYLPQRDSILVSDSISRNSSSAEAACRQAYEDDIAAIRTANLLVAVFEGNEPDEGVCIEVGYAKALGLTIIGYKSDTRFALPWGHNPMISGCVDSWITDLRELKVWAERESITPCPGEIEQAVLGLILKPEFFR